MVLVAVIALTASLPGIRNQFAQDDAEVIGRNALIHDLGNWREIVTSSYWLPMKFGGRNTGCGVIVMWTRRAR